MSDTAFAALDVDDLAAYVRETYMTPDGVKFVQSARKGLRWSHARRTLSVWRNGGRWVSKGSWETRRQTPVLSYADLMARVQGVAA